MKRKHLTSKQTCGTLQPNSVSNSSPAPGSTWPSSPFLCLTSPSGTLANTNTTCSAVQCTGPGAGRGGKHAGEPDWGGAGRHRARGGGGRGRAGDFRQVRPPPPPRPPNPPAPSPPPLHPLSPPPPPLPPGTARQRTAADAGQAAGGGFRPPTTRRRCGCAGQVAGRGGRPRWMVDDGWWMIDGGWWNPLVDGGGGNGKYKYDLWPRWR
jgi:predicted CxxxxCH...CXXCH cytochrome family protein